MPSIRKRIGYLPLPSVQQLITEISNNENLSQSKVVGILVEEALIARGLFGSPPSTHVNGKSWNVNNKNEENLSVKYNEMDELISDKGITYNQKEYKIIKNQAQNYTSELDKKNNKELFEQFKQFLLFQKMLQK